MTDSIESISCKNLICVEIDAPLVLALSKMRDNRIRHLPVVDGDQLIGIISDRDIQRAARFDFTTIDARKIVNLRIDPSFSVRDFVSWPVKTVSTGTSIRDVNRRMIDEKMSAFIVTEGDTVKGIVTHEDLLIYLGSILDEKHGLSGIVEKLKALTANSPIGALVGELSNSGI